MERWWVGHYDPETIDCERDITQDDIDFLKKHNRGNHDIEYFKRCRCKGKCLVFKDGTVLIEYTGMPLAGRGWICDFKKDEIYLKWMS